MSVVSGGGGQDIVLAEEARMTADREAFVEAMSRAVSGVSIVTTDGDAGRFGQTVSSLSSVSADPPMLLACINRKSPTCSAIQENRVFGVSLLRADQRRLSDSFAGRPRTGLPYDFGSARWETAVTGAPLLTAAVARFDCVLDVAHEAGTHLIFVGRVVAAAPGEGLPLVYARRGYGELSTFPTARGGLATVEYDWDDELSRREFFE